MILSIANTRFLGPQVITAKSVNIGKISAALYVFALNLNLLAQNSANWSDIQLRMLALFRRHKWSEGSGVRHQKWPRFFCRYRNSIQVIYLRSVDLEVY